jgi:mannan endo-1,4-beta-mannosidase
MVRKNLVIAASALVAGAAVVFLVSSWRMLGGRHRARTGFAQAQGVRFVVDGRPFRFAGANAAVMYRNEDRAAMPETLRRAAQAGIKVVRVWANGEGGPDGVKPISDFNDWPRTHLFRHQPGEWNEEEFVFLDRVLAEAAHDGLRVQLCLTNWWRDTGGVTQYLRWAGINGADDDKYPYGINAEKAMLFYTNETTRRLYREHVEKIATRRNSVTGLFYRDDPAIFGYELMNEAQSLTGRWPERRAWLSEMSAFLKSLDPDHMIVTGDWGYRSAADRREWLLDQQLPNVDYCDAHNYPRDDLDAFVDSPKALGEFIDNRAAAAFSINKPLVLGEFGMSRDGYKGFSEAEWFRAYFENAVRDSVGGAMFWIITPDPKRGYGVTYSSTSTRDTAVFDAITGGAHLFASLANAPPPPELLDAGGHLIPRQFVLDRAADGPAVQPQIVFRDGGTILYRFKPESAARERFEKLGGGRGYIWGAGAGYFEYVVAGRADRRRVGQIVVRAHLQPVWPADAQPNQIQTRVTLFVNGTDCGSRLVPVEAPKQAVIQEWRIDSWLPRLRAARGLPFVVRFEVTPESDWLYGINISNWPEGYDAHDAAPVEVLVR